MIETEAEARRWIARELGVSRETTCALERFAALLIEENYCQNLVSRETLQTFWVRHMLDSAQLAAFDPDPASAWLDLGSGPGLPGLVLAMLRPGPVTLIEARRLRVAFLERAVAQLALTNVCIVGSRVEKVQAKPFAAISARAFAPLPKLLDLAHRFSTERTRWILPKGRSAARELAEARVTWQGDFRIEPSLTDDDAGIVIAEHVSRRPSGGGRDQPS